MADLPVLAGNTRTVDSSNSSFAEGFIKTLNAQSQTLVELKNSSLGILKATLSMKDTLESNAASAGLDDATVSGNVQKKKDDGLAGKFSDMLDSMKDAFDGLSGGTKSMLGIAALLGGLALMNKYADELVEILAPILKYINETLVPNLKELNQIILDAPGGYLTLLGAAGLTKTLFDFFGKGGKIAKVIDDTADGVKALKVTPLLDDLTVRKVGWGTKIRTAFTGRMTGLFGRIGGVFTSIGTSLRALGLTLVDDLALALKNLSPTWLKVLKLQVIGGETIYPITKGGGKQIGIVGKVSQSIQKIVTSIKNLNPFKGLGASLKTLGSSWKLALSGAMFGTAAGPAGAAGKAGVLGKITNAIARIAVIVRGIFSPASILGRFTSKIRGIFAIIGRALGFVSKLSGLTSFLKLGLSLGKAIPIVGQVIMVLTGIFGFIKGAITGFKTGGILGAITGGLIGLYDGLIGNFLNLIADIIGWVFKKLGFEKFGEFISGMDFSFDGIMNGILFVVDGVMAVVAGIGNGLKRMANGIIKTANLIPGIKFPLLEIEEYKPPVRGEIKSTDTELVLPTLPNQASQERIAVGTTDVNQLRNTALAQMNTDADSIALTPEFADIPDITVTDDEVKQKYAALIAANQMDTSATGDAMVAAELEKQRLLDEKLLQEIESDNTAPMIINDNSSKSQMNNTQMVSTGLSVDATDLVAAKLNMMLPAFN